MLFSVFLLLSINIFFISAQGNETGIIIEKVSPDTTSAYGLFYDLSTHTLYFTDAFKPALCVLHEYITNCVDVPDLNSLYLMAAIPIKGVNDGFIGISMRSLLYLNVTRDSNGTITKVTTTLLKEVEKEFTFGFSSFYVEENGHLLISSANILGIFGVSNSKLYRIAPDLSVTTLLNNVMFPHGVSMNQAGNSIFQVDGMQNKVYKYDFDADAGVLSNAMVIFDLKQDTNYTGIIMVCGINVLKDDARIWLGICFAGDLILYNWKNRTVEQIIKMPVKFPESAVMASGNLDQILVGTDIHPGLDWSFTATGAIYNIDGTGVEGIPMNKLPQYK